MERGRSAPVLALPPDTRRLSLLLQDQWPILLLVGRGDDSLPAYRHGVPCRLVGGFQRNHDVEPRCEKERHIGQRVPNGDSLDVGPRAEVRIVRDQGQRFLRR